MHKELRVRTVCELACHEQHYLRPEVVAFCGVQDDDSQRVTRNARLHATSANWERAISQTVPSDSELVREIFILDCLETTKEGTWCNMWHLHALASVLKSPVRSIYPDCNHYTRPLIHKIVTPREGGSSAPHGEPINIMWTRTCPMVGSGQWCPNHFVPCIPALTASQPPLEDRFQKTPKTYPLIQKSVANLIVTPSKNPLIQTRVQSLATKRSYPSPAPSPSVSSLPGYGSINNTAPPPLKRSANTPLYSTVAASVPKALAGTTRIPTAVQHKPRAVTATLTPPAHKQSQPELPCSATTPSPHPSVSSQLWHGPRQNTAPPSLKRSANTPLYSTVAASVPKTLAGTTRIPTAVEHKQAVTATLTPLPCPPQTVTTGSALPFTYDTFTISICFLTAFAVA